MFKIFSLNDIFFCALKKKAELDKWLKLLMLDLVLPLCEEDELWWTYQVTART